MRHRMNVYFPPELLKQIADLADRKKLSRSAIVEAAVASFLSPDGADRREAAFVNRRTSGGTTERPPAVRRFRRSLGTAAPQRAKSSARDPRGYPSSRFA